MRELNVSLHIPLLQGINSTGVNYEQRMTRRYERIAPSHGGRHFGR